MSTEPTTEETTIRADAIAAVAEALRSAAGEDIANALPHANHFERRACSAVAAVWPFAERFWRDRIADEIAAIPRMATNPGMEPEDYAESAGHNMALLIAERTARRPS